jgi:hypothetical protein
MQCPTCAREMNFHGEKMRDPRTEEELRRIDPALGGVVTEVHSCPGCGAVAGRDIG